MMKQLSISRIKNPEVAEVFNKYPKKARILLRELRRLVIEVAMATDSVGILEETLKWGEPSYLTTQTKSGSTIRMDWKLRNQNQVVVYFKCTAKLVVSFRRKFPKLFNYSKNRGIIFEFDNKIPENELKQCLKIALTYHLNKNLSEKQRWSLYGGIK